VQEKYNTFCFLFCICAVRLIGATDCCTNYICLLKQLLLVIEACNAPCVLERVVVVKEKAISEEISPRPVFGQHQAQWVRASKGMSWKHEAIDCITVSVILIRLITRLHDEEALITSDPSADP
jgi:hypothetical protein